MVSTLVIGFWCCSVSDFEDCDFVSFVLPRLWWVINGHPVKNAATADTINANIANVEIAWIRDQQNQVKIFQKQYADYNRQIKERVMELEFLYIDINE